ncbi:Uncharacterised protein [Streptococcus pneumoniae]|nr:Uncharacterised protein [Streptococcus pneumoniae]
MPLVSLDEFFSLRLPQQLRVQMLTMSPYLQDVLKHLNLLILKSVPQ